jgi:NAD(P)-dependent dehydrogenase (short-subunit alcohol dehydrogenase family)
MNILITGGASGLGEAITRKFAENSKNNVYFTYCNSKQAASGIVNDFQNTFSTKCDFRDKNEVISLASKISEFDIDILINNAYDGEFLKTHFHKINIIDFEHDFSVNIVPTIILTQAAISYFRKKKAGKIITVLSAALIGVPPVGSAVYSAGKAYLAQLSKSWASENAKFGISSNTVSPAMMETKLTSVIDERMIEQIKETHPLKSLLNREEVAESIFYLANTSAYVNGTDIVINAAGSLK